MKICGLQKMTLLDCPGQVACTVFLGGCNLRCPFCHNSELLDYNVSPLMSEEELFVFLKKRQGLLDAVCISGGEPTLQKDLPFFIEKIKKLGYLVKLDTNGSKPEVLRQLINSNLLDYVAMDIKNDELRYAETCGLKAINLEPFMNSLTQLLKGSIDYELRTTVIKQLHDAESFTNIARMLQKLAPGKLCTRYYLQPFVDRETVIFKNFSAPTKQKLQEYKHILEQAAKYVEIRGLQPNTTYCINSVYLNYILLFLSIYTIIQAVIRLHALCLNVIFKTIAKNFGSLVALREEKFYVFHCKKKWQSSRF